MSACIFNATSIAASNVAHGWLERKRGLIGSILGGRTQSKCLLPLRHVGDVRSQKRGRYPLLRNSSTIRSLLGRAFHQFPCPVCEVRGLATRPHHLRNSRDYGIVLWFGHVVCRAFKSDHCPDLRFHRVQVILYLRNWDDCCNRPFPSPLSRT